MKRAIFPLFTFIILVAGIIYYYPKLNDFKGSEQTLLHDKPLACQICGAFMWNGPEAHSCIESVYD